MRILELLPETDATPPCPHFSEKCGGCLLQHAPYDAQLAAKAALLAEGYGTPLRVVRSEPLGYRNRMDFVCAYGKKGLRERGRFANVVDVQSCMLLPPHARASWQLAREALSCVEDYDPETHEGFLRYAVLRVGKDERMLIVTTRTPQTKKEHVAFEEVLTQLAARAGFASVHWTVNDSKSDVSIGERFWRHGTAWIEDEIADCRFRVYPETFFQANTALSTVLFRNAVRHARGNVLDLCCGVGTLSILAALQDTVDRVTGVEIVRQSVEAAKENAILNGVPIDKCRFVCEDAARYLIASDETFDTVLCDPARPGLERAVDLLLARPPQRIVYVSCNPASHRKDIARLKEKYDVTLLEAYDLFPQTPHVEVLSVLERRA